MAKSKLNRRKFVAATTAGLALAGPSRLVAAAEWTDQEKANVQVVNGFCAAWSTRDMARPLAFLAEDSLYRMSETTPAAKGHDGVRETLKSYVDASDRVEFKVIETFASGPIVMNHRVDTFASKTQPVTWEGVGVFFVQNGKIKEWSDYTIRVSRQ